MSDSTTLEALQKALGTPKTGMRRLPFPLESYQHSSTALSAKLLMNMYAEQQPADARTVAALLSTPGLIAEPYTVGAGPILAMNWDMPGAVYILSGTHIYRIGNVMLRDIAAPHSVVITDLGDVGTATGADYAANIMPTIAAGPAGMVVCVPPNAFTCNHIEGSVHQITGDFPGARSVCYLDGYFVFTNDDISAEFFCTLLFDPSAFSALDFAFVDGVPNVIRRVVAHRGELWFIGDMALEVWYNAGTPDFPFRRQAGGVVPYGCSSIKSVAIGDESVWWVTGSNAVMRSQGYKAERVSTHAIEEQIRQETFNTIESAGFYTQGGHHFYYLTFPDRTLVYDATTKVWHNRSTSTDGAGPWETMSIAQSGEQVLLGSRSSNKIYRPYPTEETENGIAVIRQAVLPTLWGGTNRVFCSRLEIEMEKGGFDPTGNVVLDWTDNEGVTWSPGRTMTAGTSMSDRPRVFTTRLGSFRQRRHRITMHHKATVYGVDADVVAGSS